MQDGLNFRRAWVEVDLDALEENFKAVRRTLSPDTKLCCVIKANAYGHGALTVASLYESLGADFFAVATVEEALELRLGGISRPILILGYTPPEAVKKLAEYDISQCVFSLAYAQALSQKAESLGVSVKIHIKLDSGMGRIGFSLRSDAAFSRSIGEVAAASSLPGLVREGIFTHFAKSDMGKAGEDYTREQIALFEKAIDSLSARGITFPICHAANSAAIFDYPEANFDMVRAGIVLYGYPPSSAVKGLPALKPALALKTVVDMVKSISAGESVSYGGDYIADGERVIATLPIGYADGLWRSVGNIALRPKVLGKDAFLVGRVCMDQCMLDVTAIEGVKVGDEVTVFGGDGESLEALAERLGTISYELICALGVRLPRVYTRGQKLCF